MDLASWFLLALTVAVALIGLVLAFLPQLVRPGFRILFAPRYRFRVTGLEHLPRTGPVLIVSNHVTWIDGFVLAAVIPRRRMALINSSYVDLPLVRRLAIRSGLIPVPSRGPRAHRRAIEAAREALDRGAALMIFPEAQLTRTGLTGPFFRGLEVILEGRDDVPIVPVFLDGLWGSVFSHSGGRFFAKWPRGWRRTVDVAFGPPVEPPRTAFRVRQAVIVAGVAAARNRTSRRDPLETIDPDAPQWTHPVLGPLTISTHDFNSPEVRQTGTKPGSVGLPIPGLAIRAVDDRGQPLGPDQSGSLQILTPGDPDWINTGTLGHLDRDGFVWLDQPTEQPDPHSENSSEI
jgi:acyl-[acyl-carrier-protein]-phospholipid O-acyltransferase/long-chain-fatty-acid--[acyl-carrier-protein] ligase